MEVGSINYHHYNNNNNNNIALSSLTRSLGRVQIRGMEKIFFGAPLQMSPAMSDPNLVRDSNAVSEHQVGMGSLEGRVLHQSSSLLFKGRKKKDSFRKTPVQSIIRING